MISFSQTDYYYYQGEKVFLTPTYQYVNIITANAFDETIDVSTYPTGIYVVSLVCDGTLIESKQLIIY